MPTTPLERDEYVEQAYFFRVYRERIEENVPAQEVLADVREELLATTKLPLAVDFLAGELNLQGTVGEGMARLGHYFTPFQAFVMQRAEDAQSRFDVRIALRILEHEAEYRAQEEPTPQALFIYHFECIARNRLGYEQGLLAVAEDGVYNDAWRDWVLKIRRQLGTVDFADLIYLRSQHRVDEVRRRTGRDDYVPSYPVLFGVQEGRIAKANRGKDPLYMFAALQRHLGYPTIPRAKPKPARPLFEPHVEMRFQQLEAKIAMLEAEQKGGLDLSRFYVGPSVEPPNPDDGP
jgi:hypothetical protein